MNSMVCNLHRQTQLALSLGFVIMMLQVHLAVGENLEPETPSVIAALMRRGVVTQEDLTDPQTLDALPLLLQCERLRENTAQVIEAAIQNFHGMVVGIRPSPAFHAYEHRYRQLKQHFAIFSATFEDISTLSVTSSVGRKLFECHGEIDTLLTYSLTVHLHMGPDVDSRQETKRDARVRTVGGDRRSVKATSPSVSIAQRVKAELGGLFREGWKYASLILRGRFGAPDETIITEEEGYGSSTEELHEDEGEEEVI